MDWSTFTPTLTATLLGVIISVTLSLGVYRIIHWRSDSREAKETKLILLDELDFNKETLQDHIDGFSKVPGGARRELGLLVLSRLRTSAYEASCQTFRVRLLGDVTLQRDLASLVEDWRFFNILLQRYEEIAIHIIPHLPDSKGLELLGSWDGLVMQQAGKWLTKTAELRQKLEAIK
jgi:hypothetical protein